jgi:phosphomannomutase / phosphoglucomutase
MIDPGIFREYDIRGIYGKELSAECARGIGWAYGKILVKDKGIPEPTVALARDCRKSSPILFDALTDGLATWGIQVLDLGLCPTPLLYFSLHVLPVHGGIMITASHNPKEYNGFKVCIGTDAIFGQEILRLYNESLHMKALDNVERKVAPVDIVSRYREFIHNEFSYLEYMLAERPFRVVVDSGNGTAGIIAPSLLRELGCEVHELFSEPDGDFPNHHPDPTDEKNLVELRDRVMETRADIGISFDGDADRLGVIDGRGRTIRGDQLLILLAEPIIKEMPGAVCIGEVKCSQVMYDEIERLGGKGLMWKTGHSLIKKKMKETGALIAGEMSGHIFFKHRYFGFDDAIYAAIRLIEYLVLKRSENAAFNLEYAVDAFPRTYNTPEIRMPCDDTDKFKIVGQIQDSISGKYNFNDIDGVRVNFSDGWGLIRASNTQPALIMRFEAKSEKHLKEIEYVLRNELEKARSEIKGG